MYFCGNHITNCSQISAGVTFTDHLFTVFVHKCLPLMSTECLQWEQKEWSGLEPVEKTLKAITGCVWVCRVTCVDPERNLEWNADLMMVWLTFVQMVIRQISADLSGCHYFSHCTLKASYKITLTWYIK